MKPTTYSKITSVLLGLIILSSCEKDIQGSGVTVEATSTALTAEESSEGRVVVSDFIINMKEIKFDKLDSGSDDESADDESVYRDVKLEGPFELDLLNTDGPVSALGATIDVPEGIYKEIEFDLHKGTSGKMAGKSILISGTIDGTPFEFWHEIDEEFEVDFTDSEHDIIVKNQNQLITIDYELGTLLGSASEVELTDAQDRNGNGVIEINPHDTDGNQSIARAIRENLRNAMRLIDK